jgi:hypothetical protein
MTTVLWWGAAWPAISKPLRPSLMRTPGWWAPSSGGVRDKRGVADLTQETFLRVFRALPCYDNRAKLSTWIFTIAHRVTIGFLRRTSGTRRNPMLVSDPMQERWLERMCHRKLSTPKGC